VRRELHVLDGCDSTRVKASMTQLLRERRKLADSDDVTFNVLDTQQLAETLSGTTQIMTTLPGASGARPRQDTAPEP
jgi:putative ABC transport system permease protein